MIDSLIRGRADDDIRWKSTFVTAGHITGYFVSVLTSGKPPATTPDGQPYATPASGILLAPKSEAASLFHPESVSLIGVHAMYLASAVGDNALAATWASRSATALKNAGLWNAAALPLLYQAHSAIMADEYSAAVEHALDAAAAFMAKRGGPPSELDILGKSAPPRTVIGDRSAGTNPAWADIDALVMRDAVLPAFLRVATNWRNDPERGRRCAMDLRDACLAEARAPIPSASEPVSSDVWAEAARLSAEIFIDPAGSAALTARSREYSAVGTQTFQTLSVVAYIGASLDATASLATCISLHLAVGGYMQQGLGRVPELYGRVVLPFFADYWREAFEHQRFRFAAPNLVAEELSSAVLAPEGSRLQKLLRVVADGLGARISAEAKVWIDAAP